MPSGKARYHQTVGKREFYWNQTPHNQLQDRREEIARDIKRKMKENGEIEDRVPYRWQWAYENNFGTVEAFTGSEARAAVKKALGIPKKKRLPKNVVIQRIEFDEPTT